VILAALAIVIYRRVSPDCEFSTNLSYPRTRTRRAPLSTHAIAMTRYGCARKFPDCQRNGAVPDPFPAGYARQSAAGLAATRLGHAIYAPSAHLVIARKVVNRILLLSIANLGDKSPCTVNAHESTSAVIYWRIRVYAEATPHCMWRPHEDWPPMPAAEHPRPLEMRQPRRAFDWGEDARGEGPRTSCDDGWPKAVARAYVGIEEGGAY
jgi:hypothetical protein